jgi:hypothetical protein
MENKIGLSDKQHRYSKIVFILLLGFMSTACVTSQPSNTADVCKIFKEKKGWYKDARKSSKKWGSTIPVMMAIMRQESAFKAKARPPKKKILGFIPAGRVSSSYGYSQAKTSTWRWYRTKSGNWNAKRDDFGDAIDFIGWYNRMSEKTSSIARNDTYHLYLAYHEGHGGFNRRTFRNKTWLKNVSQKVSRNANTFQNQLYGCEKSLQRKKFLGIF